MDWTTIAVSLITSGTLISLLTLSEKKRALQIENLNKVNEQWESFAERQVQTRKDLREELDAKNKKIDELYKEISILRDKADKLSSKVAFLTAYRCSKINCTERQPPFGKDIDTQASITIKQ